MSDIYCCVFFSYKISNMASLNLYGYNSKKIETTYQIVGFLSNLEQLPRSSKRPWACRG